MSLPRVTTPISIKPAASRVLAIGDVHGCVTALRTLDKHVPWRPTDTLVMLGDYVDRGPQSAAVVQWVIDRHARGHCVPLRGNHECIMLSAWDNRPMRLAWMDDDIGGGATLDSYAPPDCGRYGSLHDVPEEHWAFLRGNTQRYLETDTHIYVHANVDPTVPMAMQSEETLYWKHLVHGGQRAHYSGKVMVCGHSAQRSGLPLDLGHTICIDTYAVGGGWLTCLDAAARYCWQANERGEFREGALEEFAD
jgi:serine/threonine protein phosphatase 1